MVDRPTEIVINRPTEELVYVKADESFYECHHDTVTGDWQIISTDDKQIQGQWLLTEDDAIKYVLERAGVIEDTNYNRAPDRTSA
jgi:hypothetical protein